MGRRTSRISSSLFRTSRSIRKSSIMFLTRLKGMGRYDSAGYRFTEEKRTDGAARPSGREKQCASHVPSRPLKWMARRAAMSISRWGRVFTFMDVAGFRSEWRTDLLLGNTYGIQTELYRPFRAESRWFFAPMRTPAIQRFRSTRRMIR